MSPLPFHPITNVQALGFTKKGCPIWPVMGAAEDGGDGGGQGGGEPSGQAGQQSPPAGQQAGGQPGSDKGFPDNTPIAQMTSEQQAAYFKHQNRQADNKLSAFNGFTPQDVAAMWTRLEELEGEKLTSTDKALKEAATKAANEAKAASDAAALPRIQAAELKAAAATVIKDQEQLKSFLAIADPAKFVGDDGAIDDEKVIGHLTAIYGGADKGQQNGAGQQQRSWGQHSGGNGSPGAKPGDAGKAAAEKRFGTST